ncbi:MAG: hypothetical protein CMM96_02000 [Rickettsiales bacterium]|nr:hypothetical protein [Rickettsiales bacterium]
MNLMNKDKKIAWITGGGTGIGKELAILLAKKGWLVIISGRRYKNLIDVTKYNKKQIKALKLDITNKHECKKVVNTIIKSFGEIDLVVLNAAAYSPGMINFEKISQINQIIDVNIMGQINCISSILPLMKKRKRGHILIVSSPAGFRGLPNAGIYGVTKSAITFLAESLFFELSKFSIKIQVLHPGFVDTPMTKKNKFPMPFIISSQEAAKRIMHGMGKDDFEISFPKRLIIPMKLLKLLPNKIYFFLLNKII